MPGRCAAANHKGHTSPRSCIGCRDITACAHASHQKELKVNLDDLTIGDRVLVNLHHGPKEEALMKAIIPAIGGKKVQVDFVEN